MEISTKLSLSRLINKRIHRKIVIKRYGLMTKQLLLFFKFNLLSV